MPFGLDGCHLLSVPMFTTVSLGVGQDIDSILHLTPAAMTSVFGFPYLLMMCVTSSNSTNRLALQCRANLLVELLLL